MTIEEQNELVALGQKWLEEARGELNNSTKNGHRGTVRGFEDIGRAQGKADAVEDLNKFLEKYGTPAKLEYLKKLLEREGHEE